MTVLIFIIRTNFIPSLFKASFRAVTCVKISIREVKFFIFSIFEIFCIVPILTKNSETANTTMSPNLVPIFDRTSTSKSQFMKARAYLRKLLPKEAADIYGENHGG